MKQCIDDVPTMQWVADNGRHYSNCYAVQQMLIGF